MDQYSRYWVNIKGFLWSLWLDELNKVDVPQWTDLKSRQFSGGNWLLKNTGVFCHVGSGLHVDLDNGDLNTHLFYNSTWMPYCRFLKLTLRRWKSDRTWGGEGRGGGRRGRGGVRRNMARVRMWREAEPGTTVWKAMSSNAKVTFLKI